MLRVRACGDVRFSAETTRIAADFTGYIRSNKYVGLVVDDLASMLAHDPIAFQYSYKKTLYRVYL